MSDTRTKLVVGAVLAVLTVILTFTVVIPARDCSAIGGQPVAGIGRVVCVQPYTPAKRGKP